MHARGTGSGLASLNLAQPLPFIVNVDNCHRIRGGNKRYDQNLFQQIDNGYAHNHYQSEGGESKRGGEEQPLTLSTVVLSHSTRAHVGKTGDYNCNPLFCRIPHAHTWGE